MPTWQSCRVTYYRERLRVPWHWWLRGAVCVLVVWWVLAVSSTLIFAAAAALVTAAVVIGALGSYGSAELRVTAETFTAGHASIERGFCSKARPIDTDDFRWQTGPGADARAHLITRPYLTQGVLVEIDDPADPTPYWLVSSRNPHGLAAALRTE